MTKFYIEDEFLEVHEVDGEEFRKTLNGMKELWDEEYDVDIHKDLKEGTIEQKWTFASVALWVTVDDYEELKELGLWLKEKI